MDKLYRLGGIAALIGNAAAFIRGIDAEDLGTVGVIISSPAFATGMVVFSIIMALGLSWPAIRWVWMYPERRRAATWEKELRVRMETIELLETIRRPEDPLEGLLDPTRPAQSRAEAAIAQAKIKAIGIAPSDREIDGAGGWSVYAAQLIPYIKEFGIEHAQRMVARRDGNNP